MKRVGIKSLLSAMAVRLLSTKLTFANEVNSSNVQARKANEVLTRLASGDKADIVRGKDFNNKHLFN